MPQVIDVPGVGQVEFPDGMTDAAIVGAIQKMKPAAPAMPTTADETGPLDAMMIAAGRTVDRMGKGVQQLYYGATKQGDKAAALKDQADEETRLYDPLAKARPIATGLGEALPMMAIPVGGAATGIGFVGRSALAGAAPGLLSYGTAEERMKAGATGAAGGAMGGSMGLLASRALKPAGSAASALSSDATAAADRLGVQLTAGQRSQSPAMQGFENYLAKSPGSSGAMQARAAANQTALNTAGAKAMGQQAGDLSEGTFAAAKNGIGAEFQRLQAATSPQLGNDFLTAVAQIDTANAARGAFKSKTIDGLVDKSLDLAVQGKLTGTAYKEIRTQLSNEASSAFKSGDATLGQAYKAIRKALDDSAKGSLSKADQEAWDTTRAQWAAYKTLSKSNVAEAGNLSAPRLAAAVRQGGDGLRTGAAQGPLADIARVGEAVKGVQNPNSGQLAQQMMYGNPVTGLPMMIGNKLSQVAYMNPMVQKYLASGLLKIGPNGQVVIAKTGQPFGSPVAQQYLGAQ